LCIFLHCKEQRAACVGDFNYKKKSVRVAIRHSQYYRADVQEHTGGGKNIPAAYFGTKDDTGIMAKQFNSLMLLCEAISEENSATSDSKSSSDGESDILAQYSSKMKYNSSGSSSPSISPRSISVIGNKPKSLTVKRRAKFDLKGAKPSKKQAAESALRKGATAVTAGKRQFDIGHLPMQLFAAFNTGDVEALSKLVSQTTSENVVLFTKALLGPVIGREHVVNFFDGLIDGHPDVFILASDVGLLDETTLQAKIVIKGTRALPSPREHYYAKPVLVDNMELVKMKESEVRRWRALETKLIVQKKPIEVEYTGTMRIIFNEAPSRGKGAKLGTNYQITAFIFDYDLKSFREAIINPNL
jgi:hypothetical protein